MPDSTIVVARLNERTQPIDRGEIYEDPLDEFLRAEGIGEVTGGGSMLSENGEIEYCDVEIKLSDAAPATLDLVAEALSRLGAPEGSRLLVGDEERPFGRTQGLAVYLNGTDLPDHVYQECDVNHVYSEFNRLLEGIGSVHSHWQGSTETALYMYGSSADSMRSALTDFLESYPLCQRARVHRIT